MSQELINAAAEGNLQAVNDLISGTDIDINELGEYTIVTVSYYPPRAVKVTPLAIASYFGHTEIVKVLLAAGAKINVDEDSDDQHDHNHWGVSAFALTTMTEFDPTKLELYFRVCKDQCATFAYAEYYYDVVYHNFLHYIMNDNEKFLNVMMLEQISQNDQLSIGVYVSKTDTITKEMVSTFLATREVTNEFASKMICGIDFYADLVGLSQSEKKELTDLVMQANKVLKQARNTVSLEELQAKINNFGDNELACIDEKAMLSTRLSLFSHRQDHAAGNKKSSVYEVKSAMFALKAKLPEAALTNFKNEIEPLVRTFVKRS